MSFNSKYSGQQVESLLDQVANGNAGGGGSGGITTELDPIFSASPAAKITDEDIEDWSGKQDAISDLATIRSGASKGATAIQEEQYKGTVTGVKMNGSTKNPSNGVVDLGSVITSHQDISGKQDKLVSGTNIKTINGESILGSGDIVIEGGLSGSCAYPVVLDYSGAVQTVEPNTYYKFLGVTHIMFYFGTSVPDVVNEYVFEIRTSIGFAHASFPDTIKWANGEPNFEGGKTYQISIVNNIGLIVSV